MNGKSEAESLEHELRLEIRNGIEELRAATTEIAYLRRDLATKDEYIAYLKSLLESGDPPSQS